MFFRQKSSCTKEKSVPFLNAVAICTVKQHPLISVYDEEKRIIVRKSLKLYIISMLVTKIRVSIQIVFAMVVIIIVTSLWWWPLSLSNPLSNPLYIALIISAIVVSTTWWIHTNIQKEKTF